MNSSNIKIRQEKENIKAVSKRVSLTGKVKQRLLDKLVTEMLQVKEDTDKETRNSLYDEMLESIVDSAISMGQMDMDLITRRIEQAIKDVSNETYQMLKVEPKELSKDVVGDIFTETINGKTYSDRIWSNQVKLASEVADVVEKHLIDKEVDIKAFKKDISQRYDVDDYVARRLIDDQIARVEYKIKDECYKQSGIVQQVERITMEDDRVSEICASEHGDVWDVDDPDKPSLPRHIGCRCMYRPHFKNMEDYSFIS